MLHHMKNSCNHCQALIWTTVMNKVFNFTWTQAQQQIITDWTLTCLWAKSKMTVVSGSCWFSVWAAISLQAQTVSRFSSFFCDEAFNCYKFKPDTLNKTNIWLPTVKGWVLSVNSSEIALALSLHGWNTCVLTSFSLFFFPLLLSCPLCN